jgi:branched-chain amino acid transport system permease protein
MLRQYIANGLVNGAFIALVALGFGLIYGGCRFFAFTYGACYTWAAYAQLILRNKLGAGVAFLGGVLGAVALGVILERTLFLPLRRRSEGVLASMVVSIGAYAVLQNLISLGFGEGVRSIRVRKVTEGFSFLEVHLAPAQIAIAIGSGLAIGVVLLALRFSMFGRKIRAVVSDPELAFVMGIDVNLLVLGMVALGSALGGLAAVLASYDLDLVPTMGFQVFLLAVTAAIVGGMRSFPGMILGGFVVGVFQQLAVLSFSAQWEDSAVFVMLVVFLLFKPEGLLGQREVANRL